MTSECNYRCILHYYPSNSQELLRSYFKTTPLEIHSHEIFGGSQHSSPNAKNLCNFETQIWLEIITSRDAKSACFKGSQTSCTETIFFAFLPKFGRKRSHHVMDACCWFLASFSPPNLPDVASLHSIAEWTREQLLGVTKLRGTPSINSK